MAKRSTRSKINQRELSLWKAKDCLALAQEYLKIASHLSKEEEFKRGAIDIAYNAAELCAKGMLYLKLKWIPSTHKGVVQKFGELYVKDGPLAREVGKDFNKSLHLRNQARYEKSAQVVKKDVKEVNNLAKEMMKILKKEIKKIK